MKKIIFLLFLFSLCFIYSQSLCESMINKNNTFLNSAYGAVKTDEQLTSATGRKVQTDFNKHIAHLDDIISKFSDEKNLMGMLKVKAYAGFAYYLFNTKQYDALQALSKQSGDLLNSINFNQYGYITCEGRGMGDVQYFDEETESYYTTTAETNVTKFSMKTDEFWKLCDSLYPYFAFANYVNNDLTTGDKFFMQCYDRRYFAYGTNGVMMILAKELLKDYDASKPITDVLFASAIVYLRSKDSNTNESYKTAMAILRRDDKFSNVRPKGEFVLLSNPAERSENYFIAMDALIYQNSENKDDAVAVMKKYFLAEKKTGINYIKPWDLAQLFYHCKKNNNELTTAILKDNDPEFMTNLGDHLMKHFKEYDSASGSDVLYDVYLYYKKAGQDSKAKRAFKTIHSSKRDLYKEL